MVLVLFLLVIATIFIDSSALAQCPNTIAKIHPDLRTGCQNSTWFIVQADKKKIQAIVPYKLLDVPYTDKAMFPYGFPKEKHPVVVSLGYYNDIRQGPLYIPQLLDGQIYVPYVDRLSNGHAPFIYPLRNYIAGVHGDDLDPIIPAAVQTFAGQTVLLATMTPDDAAYTFSSAFKAFTASLRQILVPNDVSGPGADPLAIELKFNPSTAATQKFTYPQRTFRNILNQPTIFNNGLCQRSWFFFNETFTEGKPRVGSVSIYNILGGSDQSPGQLVGEWNSQGGYSASAQNVGFAMETCQSAAKNTPKAWLH